jgi:hypothetical protein
VVPSEHASEVPYTPQQLLGMPATKTTGPNILLFSAADRATPRSATITGPHGSVAVGLVNADTVSPVGDGKLFLGGGALVPIQPLAPLTTYTATVVWHDPVIVSNNGQYIQQFTFTTAHRPATLVERLRADRFGRWRVIVKGTPTAQVVLTGPRHRTLHPTVRGGSTGWLTLPHGLWNACVLSSDPEYPATHTCEQLLASGPPARVQ